MSLEVKWERKENPGEYTSLSQHGCGWLRLNAAGTFWAACKMFPRFTAPGKNGRSSGPYQPSLAEVAHVVLNALRDPHEHVCS